MFIIFVFIKNVFFNLWTECCLTELQSVAQDLYKLTCCSCTITHCTHSDFLIGWFVPRDTGFNETTTSPSFSWWNSRGVNSTHHCHNTMALATKMFSQSNFKNLLKSFYIYLIIMLMYFQICFVKKRLIFSQIWNALKSTFCLVYSFCIFRVSVQTISLCSVFRLNNKNVNTLTGYELSGFYLHSFINNLWNRNSVYSTCCITRQSLVRY